MYCTTRLSPQWPLAKVNVEYSKQQSPPEEAASLSYLQTKRNIIARMAYYCQMARYSFEFAINHPPRSRIQRTSKRFVSISHSPHHLSHLLYSDSSLSNARSLNIITLNLKPPLSVPQYVPYLVLRALPVPSRPDHTISDSSPPPQTLRSPVHQHRISTRTTPPDALCRPSHCRTTQPHIIICDSIGFATI
jgi:hypothetical protein